MGCIGIPATPEYLISIFEHMHDWSTYINKFATFVFKRYANFASKPEVVPIQTRVSTADSIKRKIMGGDITENTVTVVNKV